MKHKHNWQFVHQWFRVECIMHKQYEQQTCGTSICGQLSYTEKQHKEHLGFVCECGKRKTVTTWQEVTNE